MSCIYLAGYEADAVRRATLNASSAHADYPASRAGNGDQGKAFRWNAPAANAWLKADLDFILGGGFEDWDVADRPNHWTPDDGAGTLNEEASIFNEGAKSLNINGVKEAYQDVIVIPGKQYQFQAAIRGDATNTARVAIQDLSTLKWMTTSGTWQAAAVDAMTQQPASWTTISRTSTIESPTIRRWNTRLRIFCRSTASGDAYFDSVAAWPQVTFASVHAHNIPLGATCKLQYDSTGAFSGSESDVTTFTVYPRSFYDTFTAALIRYWRLLIVEETGLTPYIGAWSMGQHNTLGQIYNWGHTTSISQPQARVYTPTGRLLSKRRTTEPSRRLQMNFMANVEVNRDEMIEDVFEAADWGDEPLVIVPDTNKGATLQARVEDIFEYETNPMTSWEYAIVLNEDPYPVDFNF